MNTTDRNLLIGVALISSAGFIYVQNRIKKNQPVKFLGLDAENTKRFVLATAVLSGGILLINTVAKTKAA